MPMLILMGEVVRDRWKGGDDVSLIILREEGCHSDLTSRSSW